MPRLTQTFIGAGVWSWSLELESGAGIWSLELESGVWNLESGVCSWNLESGICSWILESGVWSWSLELEPGAGAEGDTSRRRKKEEFQLIISELNSLASNCVRINQL